MAKIGRGRSFISSEIRRNFSSFYLFEDSSTTKKDLIGNNDLTYEVGSPGLYYGPEGIGEKFDGTKKLSNTSITPNISSYPMFLYASGMVTDQSLLGNIFISISPWVTGYTKDIKLEESTGSSTCIGAITETFLSLSNPSKTNPARFYSIAMCVRSTTDFTTYVNGEKLTPYQGFASSVTTKNAVYIGDSAGSGSFPFHGGIFSAGWGLKDPGEDFLRRLTLNPNAVIFQRSIIPSVLKATATGAIAKFRKTLSMIGTKAGTRQSY